jgi:hypothetical protein
MFTRQKNWVGIYRKKQSYGKDQFVIARPCLINEPDKDLLGQYYQLKAALKTTKHREKEGGVL